MTSSIVIDANAAATPATDPGKTTSQRRAGYREPVRGVSFAGILRSERIKLSSLRSIKLTLLITVVLGIGLSTGVALLFSNELRSGETDILGSGAAALQAYLLMIATFAGPFLALIFGVLGVLAISSEYSSGMILSTLTAVPKRTPVFIGKAIVLAVVSALTALVLVVGGLAAAIICYPESAAQLGSSVVVSGVLGTVVYLVLISLFAFGVAALLRSTAGGIAVLAGVTFVLPIAFQMLTMTGWSWVSTVSEYLPSQLGFVLSQGVVDVSSGPSFAVALVAMIGWVAVVVVPAAIAFKRRDAR